MGTFKCSAAARALIGVAFCLLAATATSDTAQDIYAKYADSVVTINTYDECLFPIGQGSGIIIKTDKEHGAFILTNYHVIHRASLVVVNTKSGDKRLGFVCYFDKPSDMAFLRIRGQIASAVPPPARVVDIGSQVFAIGTPRGLGWTISNGIVSSVRTANGIELVQFTAPVSNGSSGGPLFDVKGELIGITAFNLRESENLNFALRTGPQTINELEKQLWVGATIGLNEVDESEWCIGHFEKDRSWMDHSDTAKSWNAHSSLIDDLEKRASSLRDSMSDAEAEATLDELRDALQHNRPVTDPLNVLWQRVDEAYASRFQDFPEDWRGWRGAVSTASDPETINKLVAIGIARWPHRYDVFNDIWLELSTVRPGLRMRLETRMRFFEAIAESLPSKDDIASLVSHEEFLSNKGQVNLDKLIRSLRAN